jgi:hypothetical protein
MMARRLRAETGYSHRLCRSREAKAPKSNRAKRKEEHPMKKQAIEKMYTEKVAELLNQGWHINTTTMPGHQGEVAHIDLTDGSEIRRALLYREMVWGHEPGDFHGDRVVVMVGRNTDRLWPSWDSTVWNNHLEVISEIEFAMVQDIDRYHPDGWFVPMEEAGEIQRLRNARRRARREQNRRVCGDAYKSVALRWLKRTQRGFKSAKVTDVTKVTRVNRMHFNEVTPELQYYEIEAKGKTYTLCPPRKR